MNALLKLDNTVVREIYGIPTVISAPIKLPNMATCRSQLRGLYEYEHETDSGLHLDCYLDFEEASNGGPDEPPRPQSITLAYALCNGVDVLELISDDMKLTIEDKAIDDMAERADDAEADRADWAYQDRQTDWSAA